MPIPSLYVYYSILQIHCNKSSFSTHADYHYYNTRSTNQLRTSKFRLTKSAKNSLDLKLYNKLPERFKTLEYNKFKIKVKQHILQHCFYSISEYMSTPVE